MRVIGTCWMQFLCKINDFRVFSPSLWLIFSFSEQSLLKSSFPFGKARLILSLPESRFRCLSPRHRAFLPDSLLEVTVLH